MNTWAISSGVASTLGGNGLDGLPICRLALVERPLAVSVGALADDGCPATHPAPLEDNDARPTRSARWQAVTAVERCFQVWGLVQRPPLIPRRLIPNRLVVGSGRPGTSPRGRCIFLVCYRKVRRKDTFGRKTDYDDERRHSHRSRSRVESAPRLPGPEDICHQTLASRRRGWVLHSPLG